MNRKLQHTVQALTTTAAVFGLLLLAGGPPSPDVPEPAILMATAEVEAIEMPEPADAGGKTDASPASGSVRRSHRAALAMPYFSFGNGGLRRVTGS